MLKGVVIYRQVKSEVTKMEDKMDFVMFIVVVLLSMINDVNF